jgi:hypothetical protein
MELAAAGTKIVSCSPAAILPLVRIDRCCVIARDGCNQREQHADAQICAGMDDAARF